MNHVITRPGATVRPLIGVPAQTLQAIDGIPAELPHSWVMNHRYLTALAAAGAAPVIVPLIVDDEDALRGVYEALDGVFIAGGVDVDPSSYGAVRSEHCGRTDLDRDVVEILLTRWARADGKPLLGVCRGLQIINVAAGGSLIQDCAAHAPASIKHDYFPTAGHARDFLAHPIDIPAGTRLHEIYGAPDVLVNSMHHQVIERLADGLVTSATAPDGLIEAIEATDEPFTVGVQWHPEMLFETDPATRRLFDAFVQEARSARPQPGVSGVTG